MWRAAGRDLDRFATLAMTENVDRGKTEAQTAAALDARAPAWAKRDGHMQLLEHGKRTCRSRAPHCPDCILNDLCEAFSAGRVTSSTGTPARP